MPARGEVLALRRAVGFLPGARLERFVVLQADALNRALDTVVVAPLDEAIPLYAELPTAVPVAAVEAGTERKQVVLATQIATLPLDRFEPVAVGKLQRATRGRVEAVLRVVLGL